jgi:hypothetical protein
MKSLIIYLFIDQVKIATKLSLIIDAIMIDIKLFLKLLWIF